MATELALLRGAPGAENRGVNIASAAPPVFPDAIRTPADALALIAAKKAIDAQKAAMAVLMLLDPNVGQRLDVAA